jgi:hypothetical protein
VLTIYLINNFINNFKVYKTTSALQAELPDEGALLIPDEGWIIDLSKMSATGR